MYLNSYIIEVICMCYLKINFLRVLLMMFIIVQVGKYFYIFSI